MKHTIHTIAKGTKVTAMFRTVQPGAKHYRSVVHNELTVVTPCTESLFLTDYWGSRQFIPNYFSKIDGIDLCDGDVIEVPLADTYIHNRCEFGDFEVCNIVRFDENDNFKEYNIGTVTCVIVK